MSSFVVSFDSGQIICHPAIKNDSGAILKRGAKADRMAAHRKLNRCRDDLCAGGLRKCALEMELL
jgi:hypothetical protein